MTKENQQEHTVAEETFLGDLMSIVIDQVKAIHKPWEELSEDEQGAFIESIKLRCKTIARKAINIIASQGMTTVTADVDSVTFKEGIKVVLKIGAHVEGRHDVADAEGQPVLLVVSNAEDLVTEHDLPEADPDQRGIDFDKDEAA